jgi:dipeptidyl aminopeptidase/acylaminoacyl peptidase
VRRVTIIAATALATLAAMPSAGAALEPDPGSLGALVFRSTRCDQGGHVYPYDYRACNSGIFRVNADGTGLTRLTGTDPTTWDITPRWSPDGTRIAFVRGGFGDNPAPGGVMVMNADGTNVHELLPDAPSDVWALAWSPVGDKVAFISESRGLAWADVATGAIHPIPRHGLGIGAPITFSPDGTRIALIGMHVDPKHPDDFDIDTTDGGVWIMDLSGDHQERLAMGGVHMSLNGFALSPDWRYLAFMLWDPHKADLWTMNLDGSELAKRTDVTFADEPVFSPFGPTLFFMSAVHGRTSLRRADVLNGGPSVPVTEPAARDDSASWNPLGLEVPKLPPDARAPAVVLGSKLGMDGAAPSASRAKAGSSKPHDRLPFLALDRSGVRRVDVALSKKSGKRCRFLHGEKLGHTTRCGKAHYIRFRGTADWARHLRKLARGKYYVRFRTTDAKGNRTKHPHPRAVRLPA